MHESFWLERWRQNQIGFHQDEINAHLQAFWSGLEVPAGAAVFVPLCGKSRDMLWLRAQGHAVLGVEISEIAVRDFFAENGLEAAVERGERFDRWQSDGLTILRGDFFDLEPADLVDCRGCYDRASLIALPPEMRSRYARQMAQLLSGAAPVLLVTLEYPQEQMQGPPFSVLADEVGALFGAWYQVETVYRRDILPENPRFGEKGLERLEERVYRLGRRD